MKTKLMFAALAAAAVFTACNKEVATPQVDVTKSLKSVTLNLSNATFTKSLSTDKIGNGADVKLNSCQVFFSDGTNLYQAYKADGANAAVTYFSGETLPTAVAAEFHFLPNSVNQVIVIGNMDEVKADKLGTVDENKKYKLTYTGLYDLVKELTAVDQQDATALKLYGIDTSLDLITDNHADENPSHSNPVYVAAKVELKPAIARFEVTGFEYTENPNAAEATETTPEVPARAYNQINVEQMTMRNFWQKATVDAFPTGAIATTGSEIDDWNVETIGDGNVFTYFAEVANKGWYSDVFNPVKELKADSYFVGEEPATTAPTGNVYAYHVFEGKLPQFLLKLSGVKGGANVPLYLMTSKLGNLTDDTIKAGNIYRMKMSFNDLDLEQPEKCIEVTVTPAKWKVNVIVPEF